MVVKMVSSFLQPLCCHGFPVLSGTLFPAGLSSEAVWIDMHLLFFKRKTFNKVDNIQHLGWLLIILQFWKFESRFIGILTFIRILDFFSLYFLVVSKANHHNFLQSISPESMRVEFYSRFVKIVLFMKLCQGSL